MTDFTLSSILKDHYDNYARELETFYRPAGLVEVMCVAQIAHQQMLIRNYLGSPDAGNPDLQRAHAAANRNLRVATEQLRQFQADRFLRDRLNLHHLPGALRIRDIQAHLDLQPQPKDKPAPRPAPKPAPSDRDIAATLTSLFNMETEALRSGLFAADLNERTHSPLAAMTEMNKRTHSAGRNQPCPCGSGQKFKFCCGKPLPQATPKAA